MALSKENNQEHIQLTSRLADKLLKEYERKLDEGELSTAGMANLQRLLSGLGWVLDDEVANSVRSKLTDHVDPKQFVDDDAVVGRISA